MTSPKGTDLSLNVGRMHQEYVDDVINKAAADLDANTRNATLPEPVFRENFLGYFTEAVPDTKDQKLAAYWVGIAGAPTLPVDIVDESGKVLFTVPPLFNTDFMNLGSASRGRSFREIVRHSREREADLPEYATGIIANSLDIHMNGVMPGIDAKRAAEWKPMYDFYGVKISGVPGSPNRGTTATVTDEEYEVEEEELSFEERARLNNKGG